MGDIYSGKDQVFGFAEGATFGTAIADDQAFNQLSCQPFTINPDVKHRTPNRATGQRWPDVADVSNDAKGSIVQCAIPTEILKTEAAFWLYLVMQNVTEVETTPFQKTFSLTSPSPDFASNAGEFITLIGKTPVASTSEKVASMIGQKLELSLSSTDNDGNLFGNITLNGITFSRTANPSGTWTKAAQTKFNFFDLAKAKIDDTDIVLSSVKLTIEATIAGVGSDGSGNYENLAYVGWNATAEISAIWDATLRTALGNYDSGAEVTFEFGWGATGVDGYLNFLLRGKYESGAIAEDDVRNVVITIHGASDIENTQDMLTAEVADAVDRSW